MDEQTKSQAIFAGMVRQAGDSIKELEEVAGLSTLVAGYSVITDEDAVKLRNVGQTLDTLTAFIQGIQATQGNARQPSEPYLVQSQPLSPKAAETYTDWLKRLKQWANITNEIHQDELRQIEREDTIANQLGFTGPMDECNCETCQAWKKDHICECGKYKRKTQIRCNDCHKEVMLDLNPEYEIKPGCDCIRCELERDRMKRINEQSKETQAEEEVDNDPDIGMPEECNCKAKRKNTIAWKCRQCGNIKTRTR